MSHPSQKALPRFNLIISTHGIIRQSSDKVGRHSRRSSTQSGNEVKGKQGMLVPIYDPNTWEAEARKTSNSRLAWAIQQNSVSNNKISFLCYQNSTKVQRSHWKQETDLYKRAKNKKEATPNLQINNKKHFAFNHIEAKSQIPNN